MCEDYINSIFVQNRREALEEPLLKGQIQHIIKRLREYCDNSPIASNKLEEKEIRSVIKILHDIVEGGWSDKMIITINEILSFFIEQNKPENVRKRAKDTLQIDDAGEELPF